MKAFTVVFAACVLGFVGWYFTDDAYVMFTNHADAPAYIYVDGATVTTLEVSPRQRRTITLPLQHTQQHWFSWSVNYGNGYRFWNRGNALTLGHWETVTLPIDGAPPATLSFENLSMGAAYFYYHGDVPIAAGTYEVPLGMPISLKAVTAYSESERYSTTGTVMPEPGYRYRFLACGESGTQGQNCGIFRERLNDGGWSQ